MLRLVAAMEQPAVDLGMERLDPALKQLREPGKLGNVGDNDAESADEFRGAAGGQDVDAAPGQAARKGLQTGLVGDGNQGSLNAHVSEKRGTQRQKRGRSRSLGTGQH